MNQFERQLETSREHLCALRLEASINRDLQSLRPHLNLRRRLARALRNLAASLEQEPVKTATLG